MKQILLILVLATGFAASDADAFFKKGVVIKDLHLKQGIGARPSALYASFINKSDKQVYLVAAESETFGRLELHDHIREGAVVRMRKINRIALPPRTEVKLKSGGLHIMAFNGKEIAKGFKIKFIFDGAPAQTKQVKKIVSVGNKHNKHKGMH